MNLPDEQLDALAERLRKAFYEGEGLYLDVAREAARWAETAVADAELSLVATVRTLLEQTE